MLLIKLGLRHHAEGRKYTRFNPGTLKVERVFYVNELIVTITYVLI